METSVIEMDREAARRLYQEYRQHRHFEQPVDAEIRAAYRAISRGQMVIKALESIVNAGADENGLPKLAIVRADQQRCQMLRNPEGAFRMADINSRLSWWNSRPSPDRCFVFPSGSLPPMKNDPQSKSGYWQTYEGIVPIIPAHLRPKHALANYHILWEAEWSRVVPKDPYLLRRLGKGDLWLVLAAWDLTEVERTALQSRVSVN